MPTRGSICAAPRSLFAGLLGLIVPLMFGRELGWPWWMWLAMAAGVAVLVGFVRLQRAIEQRGGMPLIDLALLEDRVFVAGMCATFCFFLGNLSFYFVLTLYLQNGLGFSPFDAALTVLPLAFAFVAGFAAVGARPAGRRLRRARHRARGHGAAGRHGRAADMAMLMLPLTLFGYGQGMVLAPLFSAVLTRSATHMPASGAGILTTTQQVANGTGVVWWVRCISRCTALHGDRWALLVALATLACTVVGHIGFPAAHAATSRWQ